MVPSFTPSMILKAFDANISGIKQHVLNICLLTFAMILGIL